MPQGNQIVDLGKVLIEKFQLTIVSGMIEEKACHYANPTEVID